VKRDPEVDEFVETDTDDIIERIRKIDGRLVMLDADLADLIGIEPAELRAVVRRNKAVLGVDFVTRVPAGGKRRRCLAFTEHGIIVVASLFNDAGIEALSIHLVRAFVKLREANAPDQDLARRVEILNEAVIALDARILRNFKSIYEALGLLVTTTEEGSSSRPRLH
jgi:hypothetical protein